MCFGDYNNRIEILLMGHADSMPIISTFHSLGAKLLRESIHHLGYKNDFAWQKFVLEDLVKKLNIIIGKQYKMGRIFWNVASLHVYERHFKFVGETNE